MKKSFMSVLVCLLICSGLLQAGDLATLTQKLPKDTFGFIATSGTNNFQSDFESSIMGQIAADPQVKTFFDQIIASVSKAPDVQQELGQGEDYIAFVKALLSSPTLLALAATTETMSDEPCGILLSEAIAPGSEQGILFAKIIAAELNSGNLIQKEIDGSKVYVSGDPNACDPYYIAQTGDYFLAAFNDAQYTVLQKLAAGSSNYELASKLGDVSSTNDAFVCYVDLQIFMEIMNEEAATDSDAQQAKDVFRSLGLADMQHYMIKAGFENKNLVMDGKLKMSASGGIWDAITPVDKALFDYVDPKAMQASAVRLDSAQLYDTIINCISPIAKAEGQPIEPQIAEFEETLGFKLRDDLLASLEGSMMGYMLPPYSSPELLTGGYVLTARLKDAEKFKKCMLSLETVVKSMAPAGQLQITSQKDAAGKEVHIWAVSFMAMMQVIPSWAVENDMLIVASHPNLTKKMIERIDAGYGESLVSKSEFADALSRIPSDAFVLSLTDSKAQARQFMKILQQYWPMLNMGLMQEGIQLPIMLPSIEPYIEQMQPGLSYTNKVSDGIEFHYEGTGLEATAGGAAGGAMGAAILMPALTKVKKVSQRVVCSTNLKGLSTAMVVYCMDYDDKLPTEHWCDLLIEEADVSPKSFVCPQSNAIEGESSYAMNKNVAGKNLGKLPPDTVLLFETDKGVEDGSRNSSVLTRRHHQTLDIYDEETMVYKDRFNQLGGPEDIALHHNNDGQQGCNIVFADGHVEFVGQDRIPDLRWMPE
ncbi:MAG: H-X9-DG-CTERM domain-containing protein [Planctomycetota bacterium]|jgi:prepilin-type processing-associated H-X9-DG protein